MDIKTAIVTPLLNDIFEHSINDIAIPPRPVILEHVQEEMRKESASLKRLGKLISADVSLSASLMKISNSAYFGIRTKVHSIDGALTILGLDVAGRAIAAACLRQSFPLTPPFERFWNGSAQIAALSGWLARNNPNSRLPANVAYTFGLFRDIGIAVLLLRYPHYVETLASANHETELPFTDVEQRDFGTDHARVGYLLAMNWNLPEDICSGIRSHHELLAMEQDESGVPLASQYLIATSQTAEHILHCITGLSSTSEWQKIGPACLRILGLSEDDLPALCEAGAEILEAVE
jgi:HD-like signal output (HDOD) protein